MFRHELLPLGISLMRYTCTTDEVTAARGHIASNVAASGTPAAECAVSQPVALICRRSSLPRRYVCNCSCVKLMLSTCAITGAAPFVPYLVYPPMAAIPPPRTAAIPRVETPPPAP